MNTYKTPDETPECQCQGAPMAAFFCPFGHMLECHYPMNCEEAECSHYDQGDEFLTFDDSADLPEEDPDAPPIGAGFPGITGEMQDMVAYDKPLSAAEIEIIYLKGHTTKSGYIHFLELLFHQAGDFYKALFEAIARADENNTERLRAGFPEEVDAYRLWTKVGREAFLEKCGNHPLVEQLRRDF